MADYESDSSEEETGSFVTTNVLLGYASKEATDDEISQLGGVPSWLHSQAPASHLTACGVCNERMPLLLQLHADLPERFAGHERRLHVFGCRRKACRRKPGSVRALRSTRVDPSASSATVSAPSPPPTTSPPPQAAPEKPKPSLGSAIFGGGPAAGASRNPFALGGDGGNNNNSSGGGPTLTGAPGGPPNPFSLGSAASLASKPAQNPVSAAAPSSSTTSTSTSTLPSTFAEKAKISSSPSSSSSPGTAAFPVVSNKPAAPPKPPGPQQAAYPSFFLDADYEALGAEGPPDASAAAAARVQVLDGDEPGASSSSSGDKAGDFESAHDKTFQRFADRLWHNPEQVLRYEFAGAPLLYSRTDVVGASLSGGVQGDGSGGVGKGAGMPRCASCGARRVFECQLAPHAIVELEADEDVVDGMEWGTVIVAVCERDCEERGVERGAVGYREEWAGVQWEESKK